MKNLKFVHVVCVFLAILLISCEKENENLVETVNSNLRLTVFEKNYDYYNYGSSNISLEDFEIEKQFSANTLIIKSGFTQLCNDVFKEYQVPVESKEYRSIVFYGNNISLQIDKEITGFSVFEIKKDGNLTHKLFKIRNGRANLVSSEDSLI